MDEKGCNMMCKLKGRIENGGHYDVQIKSMDGKGRALCCADEKVDAKEHYDVEIKVNGHRGHYHFQMKSADG